MTTEKYSKTAKSTDQQQTIFISGSGRSGTTWLQEIINYDNSYRILFEPFHIDKVDILKGWHYRQYIRPNSKDLRYIKPANQILSGNIRNAWIDKDNDPLINKKRIIKDIRTQFLLGWVHTAFPDIPILMIMRHPCAVANSKLALGWNANLDQHIKELYAQKELVDDHLKPHTGLLNEIKDDFEKHILLWCLEYYVPLKQFQSNQILMIFYEQLCKDFPNQINRIFEFLKKEYGNEIFDKHKVPSSQVREDSAILKGKNPVNEWRKKISKGQINRAIEILKRFGLDAVYNQTDFPLMSPEDVFSIFSN